MKSIQPFDWNQLTKNTWDDMRDDGFKPSSHSPIIDHEIQNDIDELMNSATVAESDNWISANHFYNFDDEEDIDLDIDIDALMSSTLPLEENDDWAPPLHKNFNDDIDIDTLISNTYLQTKMMIGSYRLMKISLPKMIIQKIYQQIFQKCLMIFFRRNRNPRI